MASFESPPAAKRPKQEQQMSLTSFFLKSPTSTKTKVDESKSAPRDQEQVNHSTASATSDSATSNAPIIPEKVPPSPHAVWKTYEDCCIYRHQAEPPRTKVAGLDLDGTLLNWRIAGWPSQYQHYELWNRGVITKLRQLYDEEHYQLCIFSNQGGIRGALEGKKATFVKSLVDWLEHMVDRPLQCIMSTKTKSGYHKPSPEMWRIAHECCGLNANVSESLFVGDSVGDDDDPQGGVDIQFAKNVGDLHATTLKFYTPEEFFGPSDKDQRANSNLQLDYEKPTEAVLQTRAALAGGYLNGPILLILCGVQGSGKSTFCERLSGENWVHLSQDTINGGKPGKREKVEEEARKALLSGKSVVVDRMHLEETQRKYFVDVAQSVGVPAHAVVLNPPKGVVTKRVRERDNHPGGVQGEKGVKLVAASIENLAFPKYSEGLELISASGTVDGAARIVDLYRQVSANGTTITIPRCFRLDDHDDECVLLPSIALGTMGLGRKMAQDVVSTAIRAGFEAVDTAPTYKNEDKVGVGTKDEQSFCIVKVPTRATTAAQVRKELSDSLSNLNRPKADLLLLHWPCDVIAGGTLKEVWQEMEQCKKEGLCRAIGVCNFNVQALRMLLAHCTVPPTVNQVERHPLLPQWELVDFCAKHDILLQAHSPLGQGKAELLDHPVVTEVVSATGLSPAQVVLKWNLQQGIAVVPKCSSEKHMQEVVSIRSGDGLGPEHMKALNKVSERKRFVDAPFMFGSEPYCWGARVPTK